MPQGSGDEAALHGKLTCLGQQSLAVSKAGCRFASIPGSPSWSNRTSWTRWTTVQSSSTGSDEPRKLCLGA